MKNNTTLIGLVIISLIIISAVSYHSVQEIHYLKSFFPDSFTVEEAKDASIIELIKISLISIPLTLIIITSLYFMRKKP